MIILYTTTCMASIWSIYTTHIFHLDHLFLRLPLGIGRSFGQTFTRQRDLDLTQFHYGNTSLLNMVLEKFYRLDFEGVSGRIKFNNDSGFLTRPSSVFQVVNSTAQLVAIYDDNGLTILTSIEFIPDSFPDQSMSISCALLAVFIAITLFQLTALIILHILTIKYRHDPSVKASSLKLNQHWTVPLLQSHACIASLLQTLAMNCLMIKLVTVVMCNLLCMYMGLALPHFCHVDFRDSGC